VGKSIQGGIILKSGGSDEDDQVQADRSDEAQARVA